MNASVSVGQNYVAASGEAVSSLCSKCATELKVGAEFCHVCGRWAFGSELSRLMKTVKTAVVETDIETPVLICMLLAGIFALISLFVGIRMTPKTIAEWQIIQFWRIEWLLGAIAVLLLGVLLKKNN